MTHFFLIFQLSFFQFFILFIHSLQIEIFESTPYESSEKTTVAEMENITKKKEMLKSFLSKNQFCEDFSIPLFASFLQLNPPIFVDINIYIKLYMKLLKHSTSSSLLSVDRKKKIYYRNYEYS